MRTLQSHVVNLPLWCINKTHFRKKEVVWQCQIDIFIIKNTLVITYWRTFCYYETQSTHMIIVKLLFCIKTKLTQVSLAYRPSLVTVSQRTLKMF